ncbi:MAG: nucleoside triphosphate pyrophosphohydrolase [Ilumatobacteraceae bacterium]|nr:nucleoside triphosphate pyrophosphohydrolase [Ilumatobacteraceae bacterium]
MTPRIVVVGLGPGDPELITTETLNEIARIPHRFIRTTQHPSASLVLDALGGASAFDHHYDNAASFEDVYALIVDDLVSAATQHDEVLYAVPGSPLVLERTVQLLRARTDVVVRVCSALSFLDEAWRALEIDPVEHHVQLIDGHQFATAAAGKHGPLLIAHVHANWVLSNVKLSIDDAADDVPVVLLHHLGLMDEQIIETTWSNIDKVIEADHLTCMYVPHLTTCVGEELVRFHQLARTLREQCPWDKEQTHHSLVRYLIEETYETVDAISALRADDPLTDDAFIEELGDLLYQIEFHATIAEQEGRFTMGDVARTVHDKLVSRHPHVFGDVVVSLVGEVLSNWEDIKNAEKPERVEIFDGVIEGSPALVFAVKVQQRAARFGLDWPDALGALNKIVEEAQEIREAISQSDPEATMAEVGDLLFALVNVARHLDVDPESALRGAIHKFRSRVLGVQELSKKRGLDMAKLDLAALDELWESVKVQSFTSVVT